MVRAARGVALLALGGLSCTAFHVPSPLVSTRLRLSQPRTACLGSARVAQACNPRRRAMPFPSLSPVTVRAATGSVQGEDELKTVPVLTWLLSWAVMLTAVYTIVNGIWGVQLRLLPAGVSPFNLAQAKLLEMSAEQGGGEMFKLLSWVVDGAEVGCELGWRLLRLLAFPLTAPVLYSYRLLKAAHQLAAPHVGAVLADPQPYVRVAESALVEAKDAVGSAAGSVVSKVGSVVSLGVGAVRDVATGLVHYPLTLWRLLGEASRYGLDLLVKLLRVPGLYMNDKLNPALHIPADPTDYVVAKGVKLSGKAFGLKQMYGRRWTVHAGKWDWVVPYWERVVMESQLVRYQTTFEASAVKAGKMLQTPYIKTGLIIQMIWFGALMSAVAAFLSSMTKARMFMRSLQATTYGKMDFNPVSRIVDDDKEEKEGDEKKKSGDEDDDEDDDEEED